MCVRRPAWCSGGGCVMLKIAPWATATGRSSVQLEADSSGRTLQAAPLYSFSPISHTYTHTHAGPHWHSHTLVLYSFLNPSRTSFKRTMHFSGLYISLMCVVDCWFTQLPHSSDVCTRRFSLQQREAALLAGYGTAGE